MLPPGVSRLVHLNGWIVLWSIFTVLTHSVGFCACATRHKQISMETAEGEEHENSLKPKVEATVQISDHLQPKLRHHYITACDVPLFDQPLCGRWLRGGRLPLREELLLGDQPDAAPLLPGLAQGGLGHLVSTQVSVKRKKLGCEGVQDSADVT